ncbi:hypothetical protein ACOMHN_001990 [Nucella lapillus]
MLKLYLNNSRPSQQSRSLIRLSSDGRRLRPLVRKSRCKLEAEESLDDVHLDGTPKLHAGSEIIQKSIRGSSPIYPADHIGDFEHSESDSVSLVGFLILLIGIMCFIRHATRKVLTFVSGILFVFWQVRV